MRNATDTFDLVRLYEAVTNRGRIEILNAGAANILLQANGHCNFSNIITKVNVGGVSSDATLGKLHVISDAGNTIPAAQFQVLNASPSTYGVQFNRSNAVSGTPGKAEAGFIIDDHTSNYAMYVTDSTAADIFIIDPSGFVGIGTDTPSTALHVVGDITVTGNVDGRDVSADGTTLDTHVADTGNPHSTSIANIGSGTKAQLDAAITDADLMRALGSSTDERILRWDGTSGDTVQDSLLRIADSGQLLPDTTQARDIGIAGLTFNRVRGRQGIFVDGDPTLGVFGPNSVIGGRITGPGTNTMGFGSGTYPPIGLFGNIFTYYASCTATMQLDGGGSFMAGSAFAYRANDTAIITCDGASFGSFTGGYAYPYFGSAGATSRIRNRSSGGFVWAYPAPSGSNTQEAIVETNSQGAVVMGRTIGIGPGTLGTTSGAQGSFTQGLVNASNATGTGLIRSRANGCFVQGQVVASTAAAQASLEAQGAGSFVQGSASATGRVRTLAAGSGGFAQGSTAGGYITSSGAGAFAQGRLGGAGAITASGAGGLARGFASTGTISATSTGAFAAGNGGTGTITGGANGAFAMGNAGANTIQATGDGAFAMGDAPGGNITSSQNGAFGMGYAQNYAITSSGYGNMAFGCADTGAITASGNDNSFQFGPGVNSTAKSMQVGGDGSESGFRALTSGQHGSPNSALTLGAAATTFACDSNLMTITGDAGANTIATITGGIDGQHLTLIFVDALVTITDDNTHAAESVDLSAAFTSADDTVLNLVYDGTSWYEVSRSVN